jgi:hypothetical protein
MHKSAVDYIREGITFRHFCPINLTANIMPKMLPIGFQFGDGEMGSGHANYLELLKKDRKNTLI